jgi:quercetin dioxygenase-like cupin family protein
MGTRNVAVPPGQGSISPGRSFSLKLRGGETGGSIMMFEETVPAGTKSTFHLHHDSDEVAYVLNGEVTFLIGADVTVGGPGTSAFMPREEQQRTGRKFGSMNERELADILQRHAWELLGPSPL